MTTTTQIYNFSAGPAMIPTSVMEKAQSEFLNFKNSGVSVMEMSHRSVIYQEVYDQAEASLRKLLNIPNDYHVLFLHGGAHLQFSMIVMNLLQPQHIAQYIVNGLWSKKAYLEAVKFFDEQFENNSSKYIKVVDDKENQENQSELPSSYLHYCSNETVHGIQFHELPHNPNHATLIADMSSDFLSRPININDYGLIYAGAQKNVGPSGLGIVIIKDELLQRDRISPYVPTMLDYKIHAENRSMYNTPPCFPIYMAGLVFDWLLNLGGLSFIEKVNQQKAEIIYTAIDNSNGFYRNLIAKEKRSLMNIPFYIYTNDVVDEALTTEFIAQAKEAGLLALKGHKAVGGIRASIYNAMPLEGCIALSEFMNEFYQRFCLRSK